MLKSEELLLKYINAINNSIDNENLYKKILHIEKSKDEIVYSHILHKIQIEEIKKLYNYCNKKTIDVVILKGIPASYMFFNDINYRSSNDIDILVKHKDITSIFEYFDSEGFSYDKAVDRKLLINLDHIAFTKNYGQISICVEVHINICSPQYKFIKFTERAWTQIDEVNLMGFKINVLNINDMFIHLALHFYQTFYDAFMLEVFVDFNDCYKNMGIESLKLLLDLYQLVIKYDLSYNYILETINIIEARKEIYDVLKLFNVIYEGVIDKNFFALLSENIIDKPPHYFFSCNDQLSIVDLCSFYFKTSIEKLVIRENLFSNINEVKIGESKQKILNYYDKSIDYKLGVYVKNSSHKTIFELFINKIDLLCYKFIIHLHSNLFLKKSQPYFRKFIIGFYKDKYGNINMQIISHNKQKPIGLNNIIKQNSNETNIKIEINDFCNSQEYIVASLNLQYFINDHLVSDRCISGYNWNHIGSMIKLHY